MDLSEIDTFFLRIILKNFLAKFSEDYKRNNLRKKSSVSFQLSDMKSLVILSLLFVAASSFFTAPGEITGDNFEDINKFLSNLTRTASGVKAKRGENLDFCYLSIRFFQKSQSCGCFVYDANYVATSARCVYE